MYPCHLPSLFCVCDWLGSIGFVTTWQWEEKVEFDGKEGKEVEWKFYNAKGEPLSFLPNSISPTPYSSSLALLESCPLSFLSPRSRNFLPTTSLAPLASLETLERYSTRWPECIWLDDSLLTICVEGISVEKTTLPLNTLLIPIFLFPFMRCLFEWLLIISTIYFVMNHGFRGMVDHSSILFFTLLCYAIIFDPSITSASRHPYTFARRLIMMVMVHANFTIRVMSSCVGHQYTSLITNLGRTSTSSTAIYLLFNNGLPYSTTVYSSTTHPLLTV